MKNLFSQKTNIFQILFLFVGFLLFYGIIQNFDLFLGLILGGFSFHSSILPLLVIGQFLDLSLVDQAFLLLLALGFAVNTFLLIQIAQTQRHLGKQTFLALGTLIASLFGLTCFSCSVLFAQLAIGSVFLAVPLSLFRGHVFLAFALLFHVVAFVFFMHELRLRNSRKV